ncbi:uncharacterized protein SPAPADRAFT_61570 [Spathaspora passalidarum NRRL Y-27907]|uniref:Uncharacterized protein n=1 Tax=Spathaspora passalidarum (strain NRRL Y-27907 / 11-Y1) TaxID=619300 RepID=G3ANC6_SPAPN|nr:uncharacterized protein SPAPADRAFT_61570 [Spathaspora passalidarum NRRL Y-27907]EGW32509.1 hypothetical protein SPAPADRAFT_61570 [Spathaspora passalidarum NRRL Y-27907]
MNSNNKIVYQPDELIKLRHCKRLNIFIRDLQPNVHKHYHNHYHTQQLRCQPQLQYYKNIHHHHYYNTNYPTNYPRNAQDHSNEHEQTVPFPYQTIYAPPPVNIYLPILKIEPGMSIPQGGIQIYISSPSPPGSPRAIPIVAPVIGPTAKPVGIRSNTTTATTTTTTTAHRKSFYSAKYVSNAKQFIPTGSTVLPDVPEERPSLSSSSSDVVIQI